MAGLLGMLARNAKKLDFAGQASQAVKAGKPWYSKYKDELMLGAGLGGGTALLMDQLMYDPINESEYYGKKNIEAIGEELKDWEHKPWDHENDPNYVNETIKKLHSSITDDLDTALVPRSVAKEKATDYVISFLKMAQNKEGAPLMKGIKNEEVIYGSKDKDSFGFGTAK